MRLFLAIVLVGAASVASTAACSSSSSASDSCSSSPFSCDVGQTCSAKDNTGAFGCLTSGSGKKGDACQNRAGVTTCGDGLVCLQLVASGGACASFCEPGNAAHGCAAGETCSLAGLAGTSTTFHVCTGGEAPADAGATDAAKD